MTWEERAKGVFTNQAWGKREKIPEKFSHDSNSNKNKQSAQNFVFTTTHV